MSRRSSHAVQIPNRCARCNRRFRASAADADMWNSTFKSGVPVETLCPACQTPDENAEAAINEATLSYGRDAFGRVLGVPRLGGDDL